MQLEQPIVVVARRVLQNNWNEVIAERGEMLTITAIHVGIYSYRRSTNGREHAVLRSWLVECGALEEEAGKEDDQ
jgi:hypothetical protein